MIKKVITRVLTGVLAAGMTTGLLFPMTAFAKVTKQETVYVMANADGTTKSVTVSDRLQGAENETGTLKDVSELTEIKNVKGDETFEQNGNDLTWNLNGEDIYYQGKTDKELPISVNISYALDGTEGKASDLLGKSGELSIRVKYENKLKENKLINGKSCEIATPFLMATAFILDTEKFSDVKIEGSGKVIDDGSKSIVVCLGFPGLKDSLDLSEKIEEKIKDKLKDEFTITCKVTDFEMKNTFTFASPNLLNSIMESENGDKTVDLEKIDDKIDDIDEAVGKLADGTGELKKGVKKLDKGSGKLQDGLKKYADEGVKKLTAGIRELASNAPKLKEGVGKYIKGADDLADGTKAYVEGAGQLTAGIKTISGSLSAFDPSQISLLTKGIESFSQGIAAAVNTDDMNKLSAGAESVATGIGTVNKGLEDLKSSYSNNDTAVTGLETALAANEKLLEELKAARTAGASGLDAAIATLEQTTAGEKKAIEGLKTVSAAQKAGIDKLISATATTGELGAGATAVSAGVTKLGTGLAALSNNSTVQLLKASIEKISTSIPLLLAGVQALNAGAEKLSANDKKLIAGCKALKSAGKVMKDTVQKLGDGMTTLGNGANELDKATDEVVKGAGDLKDGTKQLFSGAKELEDGFTKFRKKAVDKLLDFYHDDIKDLVERLEEIVDAGKEYKSYAGASADMDGEVKFIIETEAVTAEE